MNKEETLNQYKYENQNARIMFAEVFTKFPKFDKEIEITEDIALVMLCRVNEMEAPILKGEYLVPMYGVVS